MLYVLCAAIAIFIYSCKLNDMHADGYDDGRMVDVEAPALFCVLFLMALRIFSFWWIPIGKWARKKRVQTFQMSKTSANSNFSSFVMDIYDSEWMKLECVHEFRIKRFYFCRADWCGMLTPKAWIEITFHSLKIQAKADFFLLKIAFQTHSRKMIMMRNKK